jgi:hypothetical protein
VRFGVSAYRRHPKAAPEYLVYDHGQGRCQIAVFNDETLARALVVLLDANADEWDRVISEVDPDRDLF